MLKYQLDSVDDLDESVKGLYTEKGGKYVLGIEGLPDVSEYESRVSKMDAKINELLDEKKQAKKAAEEAQAEKERIAAEAARKNGDVEALEKSWQQKLTKREQELLDQLNQTSEQVKALTVGQTATNLANELALQGSAKALLPHIQSRLSMDIRDGKPTVVVLDESGKPSASTIDDLKKEFLSDPAFAPLIVGSKATGGGAGGGKGSGAASTKGKLDGSPKERAAYFAEKYPELKSA